MVTDLDAYRRIHAGKYAKAVGDSFENLFKTMCGRHTIAATRFPDGCRRIGKGEVIPIKTPCDWILTYQGTTALLDTKTTAEVGFPHSKIKLHQIEELAKHEAGGAKAGYVIWLRKSDVVVYVPATELIQMARSRGGIQFGQNHVTMLGTPSYFDVRIIFRKDSTLEPQDAS